MTTPPRTYTLTEHQRALISEALAMLMAQRVARRQAGARAEHSGARAYSRVRDHSRKTMQIDQITELDALRAIFRTPEGDGDGSVRPDNLADGNRSARDDASG